MQHIGKHMGEPSKRSKHASPMDGLRPRDKATERGEMMRYFMEQLNVSRRQDGIPALTMPRMGRLLVAIPTQDLYYLKSVCDQSKNFSKKFWWEIKPQKASKR